MTTHNFLNLANGRLTIDSYRAPGSLSTNVEDVLTNKDGDESLSATIPDDEFDFVLEQVCLTNERLDGGCKGEIETLLDRYGFRQVATTLVELADDGLNELSEEDGGAPEVLLLKSLQSLLCGWLYSLEAANVE